jgi:hypothetical protein
MAPCRNHQGTIFRACHYALRNSLGRGDHRMDTIDTTTVSFQSFLTRGNCDSSKTTGDLIVATNTIQPISFKHSPPLSHVHTLDTNPSTLLGIDSIRHPRFSHSFFGGRTCVPGTGFRKATCSVSSANTIAMPLQASKAVSVTAKREFGPTHASKWTSI